MTCVLGVARDCSDADIKKAYRRESLKHHPDKVCDNLLTSNINDDQRTDEIHDRVETKRSSSSSSKLTRYCRTRKAESGTTSARTTSLAWAWAVAWAAWTLRTSLRNFTPRSPVVLVAGLVVVVASVAARTVAPVAAAVADSTARKGSHSEHRRAVGWTARFAVEWWSMLSSSVFLSLLYLYIVHLHVSSRNLHLFGQLEFASSHGGCCILYKF
jgi:hypothetical protein